tara:strand:- start:35000 stop:35971 length:972 start_codon:yes stop_codon:yes gene_type:complete
MAASVAALCLSTNVLAQDAWKLGSVGAPGSALVEMGDAVAAAMTEAGGDEFSVERQYIGNEQEMVQQVLRGRIQVGATSAQGLGVVVPDQTVLAFPYLWDSIPQRDFVMENHVKPTLDELLAEKGLKLLAIGDAGFYGVFCQFDCHDPDSLVDVKVRVSATPAAHLFWETRKANGVQMPLSELWPGLEQNLVRAADIPFAFYLTTPAVESAPHFVNTNHFHAPWIFFMNKGVWDGLSAERQTAIMDGLPSQDLLLSAYQRELAEAQGKFAALGGQFYELDAAAEAKWRAGVEERLPELLENMGPGAKRLFDAVQAGKTAFASK